MSAKIPKAKGPNAKETPNCGPLKPESYLGIGVWVLEFLRHLGPRHDFQAHEFAAGGARMSAKIPKAKGPNAKEGPTFGPLKIEDSLGFGVWVLEFLRHLGPHHDFQTHEFHAGGDGVKTKIPKAKGPNAKETPKCGPLKFEISLGFGVWVLEFLRHLGSRHDFQAHEFHAGGARMSAKIPKAKGPNAKETPKCGPLKFEISLGFGFCDLAFLPEGAR